MLILAAGVVVMILGAIFHLQGIGIVGPQSSFMYTSPEWVGYGLYVHLAGLTAVAFWVVRRVRSRR